MLCTLSLLFAKYYYIKANGKLDIDSFILFFIFWPNWNTNIDLLLDCITEEYFREKEREMEGKRARTVWRTNPSTQEFHLLSSKLDSHNNLKSIVVCESYKMPLGHTGFLDNLGQWISICDISFPGLIMEWNSRLLTPVLTCLYIQLEAALEISFAWIHWKIDNSAKMYFLFLMCTSDFLGLHFLCEQQNNTRGIPK